MAIKIGKPISIYAKNQNVPAVLTENFFYDNEDDVKYILSEEGRKAVIKTHIDGITNYIKDTF